jgi:hypothetical protein
LRRRAGTISSELLFGHIISSLSPLTPGTSVGVYEVTIQIARHLVTLTNLAHAGVRRWR